MTVELVLAAAGGLCLGQALTVAMLGLGAATETRRSGRRSFGAESAQITIDLRPTPPAATDWDGVRAEIAAAAPLIVRAARDQTVQTLRRNHLR